MFDQGERLVRPAHAAVGRDRVLRRRRDRSPLLSDAVHRQVDLDTINRAQHPERPLRVAHVLPHSVRSLRQQLIGVPVGKRHDGEHRVDLFVGEAVVERIGHARDEDPARLPPAERVGEMLRDQADVTRPLRALRLADELDQPVVRLALAAESRRDALGVAPFTPGRDPTTPSNGIPCRIRPADSRRGAQRIPPRL